MVMSALPAGTGSRWSAIESATLRYPLRLEREDGGRRELLGHRQGVVDRVAVGVGVDLSVGLSPAVTQEHLIVDRGDQGAAAPRGELLVQKRLDGLRPLRRTSQWSQESESGHDPRWDPVPTTPGVAQ